MRLTRPWRQFHPRLAFILWLVFVVPAGAVERIVEFASRIEIAANTALTVTETIRVSAEGRDIRHGIYRDFPNLYRVRWGLRAATGFKVVSVTRDGQPEPWHTEKRENGVRVYFGDADTNVPVGPHVYELIYQTDRQLGFFPDHDELYWNVTGNGWMFAIERATAHVVLPPGAQATAHEAYTGPAGARDRNFTSELVPGKPGEVRFATTRPLGPHEGLTIVVSWPPGAVTAPSRIYNFLTFVFANLPIVMGVLGLFAMAGFYLFAWIWVGRDPKGGTIIPLYSPPEGLSPAAVRAVQRMGVDTTCFAANLVSLAVKGALTISQNAGVTSIAGRRDGPKAPLLPDEAAMWKALVGPTGTLDLVQEENARVRAGRNAMEKVLSRALGDKYYTHNLGYALGGAALSLVPLVIAAVDTEKPAVALFIPALLTLAGNVWWMLATRLRADLRRKRWRMAGRGLLLVVVLTMAAMFGLGILGAMTSAAVVLLAVVMVVMNVFFVRLVKAPTVLGRKVLDQIEGFERYLTVAEADRLNLENPPERTPELFDRFLPYALALDVEQAWSEQFANVVGQAELNPEQADGRYRRDWYVGDSLSRDLAFASLGAAIGGSLTEAISAAEIAPGSSSGSSDSGSSGSSGGGSSGGGGGGGGGGGW